MEAAMLFVRTLRSLTLSMGIALGTALILACSDAGPTAPDQAPSFAAGKASYVDDNGSYYCPANYVLVYALDQSLDLNGNQFICEYQKGSGGGRPSTVDDDGNQNCRNGYVLGYVPTGNYWELWDFNGNDYVCSLAPKQ
jgi:hypothetical protein